VHLVQVRQHAIDGGPLLTLVQRCLRVVSGTQARLVVNERLDVALAAGAHGVHLRADSMPADRVRALVPRGFVIGRSVHTVAEAASMSAASGLDYLVFGTTLPSTSKPGRTPAGVGELARACAVTALPVLAVGGVTTTTVTEVARSGAAGFAAISLFAGDAHPERVMSAAREAWRVAGGSR
jgi:thiamine-phosphate pyrophosphorylase